MRRLPIGRFVCVLAALVMSLAPPSAARAEVFNDYDGDGRTDFALRQDAAGGHGYWWHVVDNATGSESTLTVGANLGDVSLAFTPGDFDGDRRTDYAVWTGDPGRYPVGTWDVWDAFRGRGWQQQWGTTGDWTVPADYDGDGTTDFAVWRPSEGMWYVYGSTGRHWGQQWGTRGDTPVPGDYDGDHKIDFAVWRSGDRTWYVYGSAGRKWGVQWGPQYAYPCPDDFDGDGKTDMAFWRYDDGMWFIHGSTGRVWQRLWGRKGDMPVAGDYDGDGRADLAFWRWTESSWYVINSASESVRIQTWAHPKQGASPV
jgi:hypothetical protein